MAGLTDPHTPLPSIPAAQQYQAVSWLRWRLFANSFRRKGGKGELFARIVTYPFAVGFLLIVIGVAGVAGFYAVKTGHVDRLNLVFLGITLFQLLVSINIAPPTLSFSPESLIRFPVDFSRYLIIRLFLGLLSASTIVGTCALLAAATGATLGKPTLAAAVFAAAILLALANMLFVRMVFAWVDRWLSTRRAREIFTALIFTFSIGMQYLNVTFNNIGHHNSRAAQLAKYRAAARFYHAAQNYLDFFPSGRAAAAVVHLQQGQPAATVLNLVTIVLYAAVFLAVFGWRIQREYRGENLSEGSLGKPAPKAVALEPSAAISRVNETYHAAQPASPSNQPTGTAAEIAACLRKEFIYVRRNTAQLYSMLAPLVMVLIFAGRLGSFSRTGFTYPAAVAYALLGTAALAYNSFGLDGAGIQFYFLAPVELRSVVLAKNLFSFAITVLQLLLVYAFLTFTSIQPPFYAALSTILWAILASLLNAAVGNLRSLTSPVKMDPGKMQRRQASGLSALISLGLTLVAIAIGGGLLTWSAFAEIPWLPIPFLAVLAIAAAIFYRGVLNRVDQVALNNRETLIEALCKTSG
jgi:ABC-2 type transport system permease protein